MFNYDIENFDADKCFNSATYRFNQIVQNLDLNKVHFVKDGKITKEDFDILSMAFELAHIEDGVYSVFRLEMLLSWIVQRYLFLDGIVKKLPYYLLESAFGSYKNPYYNISVNNSEDIMIKWVYLSP